jgi:pyridoxamine 5'-phosphate oxidase
MKPMLPPTPSDQFTNWWNDATKSNIDEVNAMTLATVTPKNTPSARIVLLKGYDEKGFVFFSNYLSDKGKELSNNPTAALVFFWKELNDKYELKVWLKK